MKTKILITGAHGDLACSIARIIKKEFSNSIIIGTDLNKKGQGEIFFEKIHEVPRVDHIKYGSLIKKLVKKIDLIIPATDVEINYFNKNRINSNILINNSNIINLFNQKIKTHIFLKKHFKIFALKFCYLLKDYKKNKIKPPFFVKKNVGSGNQNYSLIDSLEKEKKLALLNPNDWVVEEYLNKDFEEYTCAIIKLGRFKKICIFKRRLHKLGHTMYAEIFKDSKVEKKLLKISDKIKLNGCINIQFKIIKNNIKIFDINTRLSSSVRMRDMIGFQDCLWWIKDILKIKFTKKVKFATKGRIIKYFEEKIIN